MTCASDFCIVHSSFYLKFLGCIQTMETSNWFLVLGLALPKPWHRNHTALQLHIRFKKQQRSANRPRCHGDRAINRPRLSSLFIQYVLPQKQMDALHTVPILGSNIPTDDGSLSRSRNLCHNGGVCNKPRTSHSRHSVGPCGNSATASSPVICLVSVILSICPRTA
jgi:hypothetical protein